ncbi:MAG: ABC transporter ATP-binding protein [Chlamydiae bacterium]|nr:ABC transporter ATP-binding protein [Chlamydiota bacterium]
MQQSLPKTLFPFIWHFLLEYKSAVIIYVALAIVAGFWGPFNSMLIKQIINLLPNVTGGDISILIVPAILIVVNFIVFDNFTWRGITYIRAKFIPVILNHIIGESMDHVLGKSHQFYQDNLSGKISKQITNLVDGVEKLTSSIASNFLSGASLLLTAIIAAYFVNPIFCFILVAWFILFSALSILMSKKLVLLADGQASAESIVVGELVDSLSNHSNVRIFCRRSFENSRMAPFFEKQQKACRATYFYSLIMQSIQGGLIAIMMACSCYFLVSLYSKNLVTIGDFALILGLSMEAARMMWFTTSEVDEFNKVVGRCKQSLMSIMIPSEIQDKPDAITLKCNYGQIIFDHVKFHYKGTEALFQNKSIEIKAGQKVGLVGYSGGGKSTFVNLILRLYDIADGAILIDGQDIRDVTQDSLRSSIALIPQDPSLFYRSLMDNIRYGRIEATDEEVISAAKKAHAHEFITKLSKKYDSLVGERGAQLSGGQRQRIAIARAILKNAPILILDEASSQLDSFTESLIQESLRELIQNKTTLVIAHRLSTLLHMDRILVFDQGVIVEDGTPTELLSLNGLYRKLWDSQVGGFLPSKNNN